MGSDYDYSSYSQTGDRVARLAVSGIRLVIGDFRTDVTKTLQSGARGKLRIDNGNPREPQDPIKWMWRFIDGAKTAGELYGRALVVICAEQYASRLVVPTSQRTHPASWHKDRARKALTKLASPHLPTSLKQLEKAIAQTHADHEQAVSGTRDQAAPPAGDLAPDDQTNSEIDEGTLDDPDDDHGDPEQRTGEWPAPTRRPAFSSGPPKPLRSYRRQVKRAGDGAPSPMVAALTGCEGSGNGPAPGGGHRSMEVPRAHQAATD